MKASQSKVGFSVVIAAQNKEKVIRYTLRAAWIALQYLQKLDFFPVEIIVVDNDSTDRTAEIALASGARVIKLHRRYKHSAKVVGITAARYPLVVTLDPESKVTPFAFVEIWEAHLKGKLDLTASNALNIQ